MSDFKNIESKGSVEILTEKLKQIMPTVITDNGEIDFDVLKQELGQIVQSDSNEKYTFSWNGKNDSVKLSQATTSATLRPVKEKSVNWDESENLYLEGDNLEVLKVIQRSYADRVKLIYLDPPYNTGKDRVYKDDYSDTVDNYLSYTNQTDGNGDVYSTNTETQGYFHTKWLNMMYARLRIARNLLKDTGVIFVSIDDKEVARLRLIMDEIFGENNFEGHIHWRRRSNQPNDKGKMLGLVAEHILVYAKDSVEFKKDGVGLLPSTGKFTNPDGDSRGPWATKPWKISSGHGGSRYVIESPVGITHDETWSGSRDTFDQYLADNRVVFPKNGKGAPRIKYFQSEVEGQSANNFWNWEDFGSNQEASTEIEHLFNAKSVFDNPKPTKLIKQIIRLANVRDNDIVMDFFSGSGTTADAVLQLNAEDGLNRRFILVQLPEDLDVSYKSASGAAKIVQENAITVLQELGLNHTLADLAEERIRRVAANIGGDFKVFKLDSTNILSWESITNVGQSELTFVDNNIVEGRTNEDVFYEVLVKKGLDLSLPVSITDQGEATIFDVAYGTLFVVTGEGADRSVAEQILVKHLEYANRGMFITSNVVFIDEAFSSVEEKLNAISILQNGGYDSDEIESI